MSEKTLSLSAKGDRAAGLARLRLTPRSAGILAIVLLGCLALSLPGGFSRDYVNHLARTHIEAFVWSDPDLARHYSVSLALIPDLTMDLVIPWLAWLVGTWTAGAATIWAALALPAAAGMVISKVLHGRVTWLSLAGFMAVFGTGAEWGFVNYVVSSGLALLAFALWMKMQPGVRRSLVFSLVGLFLALNHALAFLAFGFLALLWEVASFHEGERGRVADLLRRAVLHDFPAMLPGLLLIAFAMSGSDDLPRGTAEFFSLQQKATGLSHAFTFFNPLIGLVMFITVGGLVFMLLRRELIVMPRKMVWVTGGMLALNLLVPTSVLGIWGLHLRFMGMLAILFFASVQFAPAASIRLQRLVGTGLLAVAAIGFINGAWQMARIDRQTDEIRTLVSAMPRGASLLTAYDDGPRLDFDFVMHADAIAVIERSAYIPGLFTNTSPVNVAPQNIDLHMPQSLPLRVADLKLAAGQPPIESANGYWSPAFANAWPARWDYLLYFRGEEGARIADAPLCQVAETGMAVLYRIGDC